MGGGSAKLASEIDRSIQLLSSMALSPFQGRYNVTLLHSRNLPCSGAGDGLQILMLVGGLITGSTLLTTYVLYSRRPSKWQGPGHRHGVTMMLFALPICHAAAAAGTLHWNVALYSQLALVSPKCSHHHQLPMRSPNVPTAVSEKEKASRKGGQKIPSSCRIYQSKTHKYSGSQVPSMYNGNFPRVSHGSFPKP